MALHKIKLTKTNSVLFNDVVSSKKIKFQINCKIIKSRLKSWSEACLEPKRASMIKFFVNIVHGFPAGKYWSPGSDVLGTSQNDVLGTS